MEKGAAYTRVNTVVWVPISNWAESSFLTPTVPFSIVCTVPAHGNLLENIIFSSSEFQEPLYQGFGQLR